MNFEKKNEIVGKRSENSWKEADYWGDCDYAKLWGGGKKKIKIIEKIKKLKKKTKKTKKKIEKLKKPQIKNKEN